MKTLLKNFLYTFLFLLTASNSFANLSFSKNHILLNEIKKDDSFDITNTCNKKMEYSAKLINYKQLKNGIYLDLEQSEKIMSADNLLYFNPRNFVLNENGIQNIRIKIKDKIYATLPDGEYRTHILVKEKKHFAIHEDISEAREQLRKSSSKRLNMEVVGLFGMSIPIVIRKGNLNLKTKIRNLTLLTGKDNKHPILRLELSRYGNKSVRGNVIVDSPDNKKVGAIYNFAIYPENNRFILNIPLDLTILKKPNDNFIKINFQDHINESTTYDLRFFSLKTAN